MLTSAGFATSSASVSVSVPLSSRPLFSLPPPRSALLLFVHSPSSFTPQVTGRNVARRYRGRQKASQIRDSHFSDSFCSSELFLNYQAQTQNNPDLGVPGFRILPALPPPARKSTRVSSSLQSCPRSRPLAPHCRLPGVPAPVATLSAGRVAGVSTKKHTTLLNTNCR